MTKKILLLSFALATTLVCSAQMVDTTVRYNQYGVPVGRTPLMAESRDGILVFESANRNYKLWFDVRVQIDGAVFFGVAKDLNPIGNGASIRRARFAIKSQITKNWYGELDNDFANGSYELKDALVRYSGLRNLEFTLGNFKEDFSMSQTTSSRYLPFMERPMVVQTFAPSRHLGFEVRWQKDWWNLTGGVFFQAIEGAEARAYVEDNNKDYGRSEGMSFTAKAVAMPFYNDLHKGLHLGVAFSYRQPKTDVSPGEWDKARFSTRNSTSINRKKYLDTGLIPDVDHDILYGFELAAYRNSFRFQGEYIANNTYIKNTAADHSTKYFNGWYAQAGYLLFGGMQRYNKSESEFTQPSRGRKWGDIELMLRYDYLNLNSNTVKGGAGENYTFGINYYINQSVKFVLNYQYTNNDRYANGNGKYFIGHTAAGVPTKNPALAVEGKHRAGVDYSMIGMRMEVDF